MIYIWKSKPLTDNSSSPSGPPENWENNLKKFHVSGWCHIHLSWDKLWLISIFPCFNIIHEKWYTSKFIFDNRQPVGMCCITQGAPTGTLWQPRGVEGGWREKEGQDGGDVCIPMVDSYWCMAETNTILQNNCPSIKNKFFKMETTREMWSLLFPCVYACPVASVMSDSLQPYGL